MRFYRIKRDAHLCDNLVVREPVAGGEQEDLALLWPELTESAHRECRLGAAIGCNGGIRDSRELVDGGGGGLSADPPATVDESPARDHRDERGLRGSRRVETAGAPPHVDEYLLHRVLGIGHPRPSGEGPHEPPVGLDALPHRARIAWATRARMGTAPSGPDRMTTEAASLLALATTLAFAMGRNARW